jgi:putative FmdB family regulatory protein
MPTYEYQCTACDHRFEQFQSIKAGPVRKCPACGKPKVRRLLSVGAGLIFKGSGFYATDYRSSSYKEAAKKDAPASPSPCSTCDKADPKTCKAAAAAKSKAAEV